MKELVAGNYFVKKESVLLYLVIEGIGTFLKIAKAIILENPTTYSETDILLDFQKNPDAFIIVEESNIWSEPEVTETPKAVKKSKEKVEVIKKEYTEEDIPVFEQAFVNELQKRALENGRVDTIAFICTELQVEKELAEIIYQKYA